MQGFRGVGFLAAFLPSLIFVPMLVNFSAYNYTPLFNLKKSDFIDFRSNFTDFIPFGIDNLLPTQLNKLCREVPIHRAIINSKVNYIVGKGLSSNDTAIKYFINAPNNQQQDLATIIRRITHDYLTTGNAWLEVVTNKQRSFFYLYHVDASKVRISTNLSEVIIHPDWEQYKKNDKLSTRLALYPKFSKGSDSLYHSVYHIKNYEPEFYHYGVCSYFAGLRSIIISGLTNIWNQRRLERHFSAPGLLVIPGVNSDDDAQALDEEFQKYMGASGQHAADIIIQYLQDLGPGQAAQAAQYIAFLQKEEGNWLNLHKQAETDLISIHNWFHSLTPFSSPSSVFDQKRIINEYEVAMSTVINPLQSMLLSHLNRLFAAFNYPVSALKFMNEPPIQRINPFKYVWEVRRDSGLDFDPSDPIQRQLVIQVRNTFGGPEDMQTNEPDNT